jgi:AraC-like DNA-binding protein
MMYLTYIPVPPLCDLVELFWLYEGGAPDRAKKLVLPTGTVQMVIDLRDEGGEPWLWGVHSKCCEVETTGQESILCVLFKPGGAYPLLPFSSAELHNCRVPLNAVWGRTAASLRDRLRKARTPGDKFHELEQALLAQIIRPLSRRRAVTFALGVFQRTPSEQTVTEVAARVGLRPQRLIQLFSKEVGLTPKRFCRIRRFLEVLRCIGRGRQVNWARVALACGYYDQAHLIRDFRAFSGLTPTAFLDVAANALDRPDSTTEEHFFQYAALRLRHTDDGLSRRPGPGETPSGAKPASSTWSDRTQGKQGHRKERPYEQRERTGRKGSGQLG